MSTSVPFRVLSAVLNDGLRDVRLNLESSPFSGNPTPFLRGFVVYVIAFNVDGLEPGVYVYHQETRDLDRRRRGRFRGEMARIFYGLPAPRTAAWTVCLAANWQKCMQRYPHERGLRNVYVEAGYLGQKIVVIGATLGLASLVTPATRDRLLIDLLQSDRHAEAPIYTITMGFGGRGT